VLEAEAGRNAVRLLHWVGAPPNGVDNDHLSYSLTDHLGSSLLELDEQGEVLSEEGYLPFGGRAWWIEHHGAKATYKTRGYSGKERDATGLYYYGYRYYAPWQQRWINPDPAGEVDGLNLFCFVSNSPVRYIDRDGRVGVEDLTDAYLLELARDAANAFAQGDRVAAELVTAFAEADLVQGLAKQLADEIPEPPPSPKPAIASPLVHELPPVTDTLAPAPRETLPVIVQPVGTLTTATNAIVVSYELAPSPSGAASENVRNEPQPSTSAAASSSGAEQPNTGRKRKRFVCPTCDKSLGSDIGLERHMRTHTGEMPFQCDVCQNRFKLLQHLQAHKRIHTGERAFKCEVCGLSFIDGSTLTRHMRTHTGERPFQCDICHTTFNQKSALTKHNRGHARAR